MVKFVLGNNMQNARCQRALDIVIQDHYEWRYDVALDGTSRSPLVSIDGILNSYTFIMLSPVFNYKWPFGPALRN